MIEIFYTIGKILLPFACIMMIGGGILFYKKDKIYYYSSNEWLSPKDYPIPDDIWRYIATDGEKVKQLYEIDWAPHGEIYFDKQEKTLLKFWMPLPNPPKNEIKLFKGGI